MSGLISWRNWADTATLTPVFPPLTATIDGAYPLTNLQTRQLTEVCRYSTGGLVVATADLGSERPVKLVSVLALRARRFEPGSGSSNAWYYTVQVSKLSDFSVLEHDVMEQSLFNPLIDAPAHVHQILPDGIRGRYVRVKVDFAQPLGDTFREAGRLWIGDALSLPGSVLDGGGVQKTWRMAAGDPGLLDASRGQQHFASVFKKSRRAAFDVLCNDVTAYGFTDADVFHDGLACLQALQFEAGTTGEVIAMPRTKTPLWIQATNVYGHVERPFDIVHVDGPNYSASLAVIEER